jgi:phosphohistidine phosphatase
MELYLLRHAIAVLRGAPGYDDDSKRPLTPEGERKMRRIARAMQALDVEFDLILSSPFTRARQTAEIVAGVFRAEKKLVLEDSLTVGGDLRELIHRINTAYGTLERILLIGHEPSMSELISVLIAGDTRVSIALRKGGLCKLTTDALRYGQCATLECLLTPKQLTRL